MKSFLVAVCCGGMLVSAHTFAAQPTDINYCAKGKSGSEKYSIYTVRCSDGSKREITAWNNRKKWCVGNASKRNCSGNQLTSAKKACRKKKK
ncbi:MAG: hypothetical protein GY862_28925 [Gammaproteobacteria bacterium]|nr:hypothetical protein [Gammaproteobacteria bacterium]